MRTLRPNPASIVFGRARAALRAPEACVYAHWLELDARERLRGRTEAAAEAGEEVRAECADGECGADEGHERGHEEGGKVVGVVEVLVEGDDEARAVGGGGVAVFAEGEVREEAVGGSAGRGGARDGAHRAGRGAKGEQRTWKVWVMSRKSSWAGAL